eukprot:7039537-Prymnesium_polylepis.1
MVPISSAANPEQRLQSRSRRLFHCAASGGSSTIAESARTTAISRSICPILAGRRARRVHPRTSSTSRADHWPARSGSAMRLVQPRSSRLTSLVTSHRLLGNDSRPLQPLRSTAVRFSSRSTVAGNDLR